MKKINRADLLAALFKQLDARDFTPEEFTLPEIIVPTVDISRPSKIPYADWVSGFGTTNTAVILPAKAGKRIVVTRTIVTGANISSATGEAIGLVATVNGNTSYVAIIYSPTLIAGSYNQIGDCEFVCDVNTPVTLFVQGSYTNLLGSAVGFYIPG